MGKPDHIAGCRTLEDLPNIGRAIAGDLRRLGIAAPGQLRGRDPYALYDELCRVTRQRHDPCLLDTFIAAVRFAEGGPAQPWWRYTAERKQALLLRGALEPGRAHRPTAPARTRSRGR